MSDIGSFLLDGRVKGMPGGVKPFRLDEIGAKGWNLLREDLPLRLPVTEVRAASVREHHRHARAFVRVLELDTVHVHVRHVRHSPRA